MVRVSFRVCYIGACSGIANTYAALLINRTIPIYAVIEQKIVSAKVEPIMNDDLVAAVESIERKYSDEFSVVTMFDRKS